MNGEIKTSETKVARTKCVVPNPGLLRKTLENCLSEDCLTYINGVCDEEDQKENLTFHASLLLGQLRALFELDTYHQNYPWRTVLALDVKRWSELLADMKLSWQFVREICDTLHANDPLHTAMGFTRHQPFRDVMIAAEFLSFLV